MAAFELVADPRAFRRAADALSCGRGPFAVDTERASNFRYDDRAFLVQVYRRDAGTFLIAPEGHRDAVKDIFAPVLGGGEWVLHAAGEDLPSLGALGLYPGAVFDTELAGRLAGLERTNLAAVVREFTGVELQKGHGREDWSQVPLPDAWLQYAALDVAYLLDVAEALTEYLDRAGKLDALRQELDHVVDTHGPHNRPTPKTWRDLKGVSRLRQPESLAVAQALWERRDEIAFAADASPHSVLPGSVIIAIAASLPATPRELAAIKGFPARRRGETGRWFDVVSQAYSTPREQWPLPHDPPPGPPSKSAWQRHHPQSWERLVAVREALASHAARLDIAPEVLLTPAVLRQVVWELSTHQLSETDTVARALSHAGAREWQVAAVAPTIAARIRSM
ncbi:HRDC domain-containing protein [Corynebacterium liangguodongii]|uniref:Ribonuclease D n=1 Tax=Corynebacterium liangguodongii TaxID=2079535 RepID=A0A2S0WEG6_9CORY|nr:HRDC domain-containing protein [Corynebacterium liangguodongii]AWB84140.1 ribonuclease D [Corynebacterium liangguodongii]PWC00151.1 ribonuclease D [Corynebacterium liangguodongii]